MADTQGLAGEPVVDRRYDTGIDAGILPDLDQFNGPSDHAAILSHAAAVEESMNRNGAIEAGQTEATTPGVERFGYDGAGDPSAR